jgi:hypothetical protein
MTHGHFLLIESFNYFYDKMGDGHHKMKKSDLFLNRLKPDVEQRWLLLIAGLMWGGVGAMLGRLAIEWLRFEVPPHVWVFLLAGAILAAAINHWGFARLAKQNVDRIKALGQKACIFAFQRWTSYVLVVVMITMGRLVRLLPIPRSYLAILYLGIGGALFLASLNYLSALIYKERG